MTHPAHWDGWSTAIKQSAAGCTDRLRWKRGDWLIYRDGEDKPWLCLTPRELRQYRKASRQ